jgi:ribonuclease HI
MFKNMLNNATITTDASFYTHYKIGSYAFWITTSKGSFKQSGVLKGNVYNSTEAEMKAITNALYFLSQLNQNWYAIRINTDSEQAKKHLDQKQKTKNEIFLKLYHTFTSLKNEIKWKKFKICHIKAHTNNADSRSYVNSWCDLEAKKQLKKAI